MLTETLTWLMWNLMNLSDEFVVKWNKRMKNTKEHVAKGDSCKAVESLDKTDTIIIPGRFIV